MPRASAFLFPLGVLALTRTLACANEDESFRIDVFYCENAIEHARACCPTLTASKNSCRRSHYEQEHACGCSGGEYTTTSGTNPALTISDSERILDSDCSALRANEGCERVQVLVSRVQSYAGSNYATACGAYQ